MNQLNDKFQEVKGKLFKEQIKRDFIEIFFELSAHQACRGNKSFFGTNTISGVDASPLKISRRGETLKKFNCIPCNTSIIRQGEDIYNNFLETYNSKVFLPSLWFSMYDITKNSNFGRELTRAFIKNSLFASARLWEEDLIAPYALDDKSVKKSINIQKFYKEIFDFDAINKCMRKKGKRKLPKDNYKLTVKFSSLSLQDQEAVLDNIGLGEMINVIKAGFTIAGLHSEGIKNPLNSLLKIVKTTHLKRKLKSEISNLKREKNG